MPKDVGNYIGITTDGTSDTSPAKGFWNVFDQIRYKRNNKWPKITLAKASGGTVVEDGTRAWHVFALPGADPSSPAPFSFNTSWPSPFPIEILVVGGGGSGGDSLGGGGGAGGIVHATPFTVPGSSSYSLSVGAGGNWPGAGAPASGTGDPGDPSTMSGGSLSLTGLGGGGGGYYSGNNPLIPTNGGSGGGSCAGAAGNATQPGQPQSAPGATVNNWGNAGAPGPVTSAGSGGGAGGPAVPGPGGPGRPFPNFPGPGIYNNAPTALQAILTTTWRDEVGPTGLFGGGGGGGGGNGGAGRAGGPGGGGDGGGGPFPSTQAATPGVDGTGGGGGAGGYGAPGIDSDGGDGIIIITYT